MAYIKNPYLAGPDTTSVTGNPSNWLITEDGWGPDVATFEAARNAARKYIVDYITANTSNKWWHSLDNNAKLDLIENFKSSEIKDYLNMGGMVVGKDYTYDVDDILSDLTELDSLGDYPDVSYPVYGDYVQSSDDIYADINYQLNPYYSDAKARLDNSYNAQVSAIDQALANLDAETASMQDMYKDQLKENFTLYNQQANRLLSNQYLANAQTYDALQSDMRKSRQNALEAGASAGLRLANNVNTLLSAQNKQSQISMDTSNSLAEMLLQQRQAASGIRSSYANYMQGANRQRSQYGIDKAGALSAYNSSLTDLDSSRRSETESMYGNRYNTQVNDYNRAVQGYNDTIRSYEDRASSMEGTNSLVGPYTTWAKYK